jgi:hypothetical protein
MIRDRRRLKINNAVSQVAQKMIVKEILSKIAYDPVIILIKADGDFSVFSSSQIKVVSSDEI